MSYYFIYINRWVQNGEALSSNHMNDLSDNKSNTFVNVICSLIIYSM